MTKTARKKTTAQRTKPAARRRNPGELEAAAQLSEQFHGRPARKVSTVDAPDQPQLVLAELGRLVELEIQTAAGVRATLQFRGVKLASSPDGGQLYFAGGDQSLDLAELGLADQLPKDHVFVGHVRAVVYATRKGFHNFEQADYRHRFGEEGGSEPALHYDTQHRLLYLTGGTYQTRPEGITN